MKPLLLLLLLTLPAVAQTQPRPPGELRWAIRYDPRTLDPAKVDDASSELLRFLTAGTLLRLNRQTQLPEPALADRYTTSPDGRLITFHLRPNLRFSDGSPLTSRDVAASLRRVLLPATAAPVAQEFLAPTEVRIETPDPATIRVLLPRRVLNLPAIFDEIAIEPATPDLHSSEARITAGPFTLTARFPGQSLLLTRNANFYKPVAAPSIRLEVLSNREQEIARFSRGDLDLIDPLPPDFFPVLQKRLPGAPRDLGPSLNTEQLWFNQSPTAPIPPYELAWFQSQPFRVAISQAIHRADLARIAFDAHATPARTFISPANAAWFPAALRTPPEDLPAARRLLAASGFHLSGTHLYDAANHPVRFSILTNAGNAPRLKMATLIQQDLAALGIEVSIVTLDFPALIERLLHTQNYEACLLGHPNVDPDPNSMLNEWLSSSPNHQWNPSQKTPATPWEAEIDALMRLQASAPNPADRHRAIDRVAQIVADQQPFIYLVHPNALYAVSPSLLGVAPTIFSPGLVWNIESIHRKP